MNSQIFWYTARSAGIVAWLLVTLSVCWGLLLSTRVLAKASPAPWLLDLHRFLSTLSVMFTAIHLASLVLDDFVYFGLAELFVPFAYETQAGAVAWGIVAFYLLVAVELTSVFMRRIPRRIWKVIHRLSLVLYVVATVHAWQAGTDADNPLFGWAVIASVFAVTFLTLVMVLRRLEHRPRIDLSNPAKPSNLHPKLPMAARGTPPD